MTDQNGFAVDDGDDRNPNRSHHRHSQSHSPTSISQKLHSSISNISCCFAPNKNPNHHPISPVHVTKSRILGRSSSAWMKFRENHYHEFNMCRTLISRIRHGRHRRHHSADFHYDALSYSRNFDGEDAHNADDGFPFRSFSSRLPQSPPAANNAEDDDDDNDEDEEKNSPTPSSAAATGAREEITITYI
ncbi:hypothetical protein CsatB_013993 [Cannabis sativa]